MSLLEIDGLDVATRSGAILRGVSLSLDPGEIAAITGESGSGKSMTAFSVMGLLPEGVARTGGRILLGGEDISGASEAQLCRIRGARIGMIFQEPMTALNPVQTIGAQVAETLRRHLGLTRAAALARARETLARVGLPEDRFPAARYPHQLSGGQRQRVIIALAIAAEPEVLIADEPTTALDVTTQARILDLLKGLVAERNMGLLIVTHDLAVVADIADRLVVMKDGRVVEQGPTEAVLRTQSHPYTRSLLAASAHRVAWAERPSARRILLDADAVQRTYLGRRKGLFGPRRETPAVKGVSFHIDAGERVGLVGESGCGKSTLTRAILGLDPIQGGEILIDGAPVDDARGRVQVVFQDPYGSFNPRHRVGRLVAEPFHLLAVAPKGPDRRRAVADALEAVGLKATDQDRYIHEFSGGQRQRIAIARALIVRPELVVLDEAVSALDVSVRARILDLLADLSQRFGLAYLFISHDLSVVRGVTDRVLVMQAGEIVEEGETEEVFRNPRHPYTRELLAAVPVLPDYVEIKHAG